MVFIRHQDALLGHLRNQFDLFFRFHPPTNVTNGLKPSDYITACIGHDGSIDYHWNLLAVPIRDNPPNPDNVAPVSHCLHQ